MSDIIDRIDAATGCHQCEQPLGHSPSDMFCSEDCQSAWQSKRVGMAAAWWAPRPVPLARVFIGSSGQSPNHVMWDEVGVLAGPIVFDTSEVVQIRGSLVPAVGEIEFTSTTFNRDAWESLFGAPPPPRTQDEVMRDALEARRHRNTGPAPRGRAPRRLDPRRPR